MAEFIYTMHKARKAHGDKVILDDVSMSFYPGAKIGMVGPNGAGKSTILKIMAGLEQPSNGEARLSPGYTVGILMQEPPLNENKTVLGNVEEGVAEIKAKLDRYNEISEEMANPDADFDALMEEMGKLQEAIDAADAWDLDSQLEQAMDALRCPPPDADVSVLSGGERRRVALCKLLLEKPDLLLLDEPTNHLDAESVLWLRDYLKAYSGGLIVISHDLDLIDEVVNKVFFLDATRQTIDIYSMGYRLYLKQREDDERRRRRERANAEKKAAALTAQANKMMAKATKTVAAQQMVKRAERMLAGLDEERSADKVANLRFPAPADVGRVPLTAEGLSRSFGSTEVFTGVDLAIDKGSRVVILGYNGAGKTTLLRLLAGLDEPDSGEVIAGHGLKLGYYAQEHETLDLDRSVLENMQRNSPHLDDTAVRNVLGSFLFSGDDVHKPAGVLSGGEKTRLALATLVVSSANVLLLDEPTNNLDPASREEILSAIRRYEGAIILVTHDEGAVSALDPDRVLLLPDGDEDLWNETYLDLVTLA